MNQALILALLEIATKAYVAIQAIRKEDPEAYANVSKHTLDALAKAKAALDE